MTQITGELPLLGHVEPGRIQGPRVAGRVATAWKRGLREPFVHFLLLGSALFCVSHWLEERSRFTRILITRDNVHAIAENYRLQYGRYPTPTQLESLVDGYVREEVYYHEAQKLGLDEEDEIVRRRLVQKYEFLQQDLTIAAEPAEADLRKYFQQHAERYRQPATVAFSQVYFSVDRRGDTAARAAAEAMAAQLNARGVSRAPDRGDAFPGPQDFPTLSAEEAERVFGQGALTNGLFQLQPGRWSAPLRSTYGWHVLHVDRYAPARPADFPAVQDQVRRDFLEDARAARNDANYADLRKRFEIRRE
jgi:peptidyl-prolyl cis-trans isomerase C